MRSPKNCSRNGSPETSAITSIDEFNLKFRFIRKTVKNLISFMSISHLDFFVPYCACWLDTVKENEDAGYESVAMADQGDGPSLLDQNEKMFFQGEPPLPKARGSATDCMEITYL